MGGQRVSNEVVYFKTETTYNTDPTPTTTDAILVRNVQLSSEGLRMIDRASVRAGLGATQMVYGGTLKRITFECEVKGSGTAGTAPEIGPLIEACGFEETVVALTSVTYNPENGTHESGTFYYFEGGVKKHILTGCRGNVTFRTEAGGLLLAVFEFVGHYTEPTDIAIPSPSYDSTVPRAAVGMAIAINGVTAISAKSWEWMANNTIATPGSVSATDGYGEVIITKRDIRGSVVIESELDSVIDVDSLMSAGTKFTFTSGTLGSVAGNRVVVSTAASSTYITDAELGEADGLRLRTVPMAIDDAVASNFAVAFT
jgi:hypothetical protein